ncbi:MAG: LemA family protein [Bacteroidetes bacterium]|nr:LemA family protein [Bacteroidota bacterium]
MSRGAVIALSIVGVFILIILGIVGWGVSTYNKLVTYDQNVKQSWGEVETQYQRRVDLIPNLVATVKGYAKHEASVFEEVANARASAGRVTLNVDPKVLQNPQAFARFQQVQGELGNALTHLMAVAENYPNLKADQNFLALQAQLEGTENRIAVARMRFNLAVQGFNTLVLRFPSALIASMTGFHNLAYFQAAQGAATAPQVHF